MIVQLATWDEIQARVRAPIPLPYVEPERFEIRNGCGEVVSTVYAAMQGRTLGCRLCGHEHDAHSKILPFEPCLDCDCIGWTTLVRPDPVRRTR